MDDRDQLREMEAKLADLQARLPAHTPSPRMLLEMDDLEEEIGQLRSRLYKKGNGDAQGAS